MANKITMEKWHNGGGVTLRVEHEYGGALKVVSLDFADVANLKSLLDDYQKHPSPYLLATSKSGTHWEPRDQGLDGGLVSSLRALL